MTVDPLLLARAAFVYVAVVATAAICAWKRPTARVVAGAALAFAWNLPALLLLHVAAAYMGWWRFEASGGLLLGMPVDVYLSWAWLWGGVPALLTTTLPLGVLAGVAFAADLLLMPAAEPVVRLGPSWLVGEAVGLVAVLLPGQLMARWTIRDEQLARRTVLQMLTFGGLVLVVVPVAAIEGSGSRWVNPLTLPAWQLALMAQGLGAVALLGLTAVQEFVTRGHGTPVPFDPPRRLVTTGIYAYVRNPMQLSGVLLLLLVGLVLWNPWVASTGVMAHLYALGLAGWDEDDDLRRRFGARWVAYRKGVRAWLPRLRPWHDPGDRAARLFVAQTCGMCREVGLWFSAHDARHLEIVPAEAHPSGTLTRITYEPGDGSRAASGVAALARALEHVHVGWAFLGWLLRVPGVGWFAQLLVDASGGEPRRLAPMALCEVDAPRGPDRPV